MSSFLCLQWTAGGLSGPNGQDAVQHAEVEHDQEDVPVPIHHRPMTDQDVLADTWRLKGATHNRVQVRYRKKNLES